MNMRPLKDWEREDVEEFLQSRMDLKERSNMKSNWLERLKLFFSDPINVATLFVVSLFAV
jgi:hypothetical protein